MSRGHDRRTHAARRRGRLRGRLLRHRIPKRAESGCAGPGAWPGVIGRRVATGWSFHAAAVRWSDAPSLVPFYLLRGMGAGDVKLMAAAGAFLGPSRRIARGRPCRSSPGAVLAVGDHCVATGRARPIQWVGVDRGRSSRGWRRRQRRLSIVRKERFPYAVAIAVGVVATLWLQGSLGSPPCRPGHWMSGRRDT